MVYVLVTILLDVPAWLGWAHHTDVEVNIGVSTFFVLSGINGLVLGIRDLSERTIGRFQITTDGLRWYIPAIEAAYGANVDFAQLLKLYGKADTEGPEWYNPTTVRAIVPIPITGDPKLERISTSHVERANLSVRTHLRRFTRLSLGFSKTLEHLSAAVNLYMAFFNFCRVHQTLRVTPAMQAGIADHVWSIQELLTWTGE